MHKKCLYAKWLEQGSASPHPQSLQHKSKTSLNYVVEPDYNPTTGEF